MGEHADGARTDTGAVSLPETLHEDRSAMGHLAELLPGSVYSALAATSLDDGGRVAAPLIVDTDLGGDADDAVALAAAALSVPELALVTTVDETSAGGGAGDTGGGDVGGQQRARAARWLLDSAGRGEVPVVAGSALPGSAERFVLHREDIAQTPAVPAGDPVAAIRELAHRVPDGPLRWVGIGPLSNLARITSEAPDVAARLVVTQMGAAIDYRHPDRAEHNIRMDVAAAHTVFAAAARGGFADLELVISDVTFTPALKIAAGDHRHRAIAARATDRQDWARPVARALRRWFDGARGYPSTLQHDALTLSAALDLPFVRSSPTRVELDDIGRMRRSGPATGALVRVAHSADYDGFWRWLDRVLQLEATTPAPRPEAQSTNGARPGGYTNLADGADTPPGSGSEQTAARPGGAVPRQ